MANMATNNVILHLETEIHRLRENNDNLKQDLYVSRIREEERRNELHISRAINDQMVKQNHMLSKKYL